MEDKKYRVLIEEVRGMREEIARIDRDLNRDRQDIGNFKVELETLQSEIKQMRGALVTNADKVEDRMRDTLKPAVREVSKLREEIKKKKTMVITSNKILDWIVARLPRKK